jgi:hypothetical protein
LFGGVAVSNDGFLDLAGGIFGEGEPSSDGGEDRHAAGLAELQGGLGILPAEGGLDRGLVGPVFPDDLDERFVDQFQPFSHRPAGVVPHHPRRHQARPAPREFDDAVPGDEGPGVNPEDEGFPGRPGGRRRAPGRSFRR